MFFVTLLGCNDDSKMKQFENIDATVEISVRG
jgi:hypothetical protein